MSSRGLYEWNHKKKHLEQKSPSNRELFLKNDPKPELINKKDLERYSEARGKRGSLESGHRRSLGGRGTC